MREIYFSFLFCFLAFLVLGAECWNCPEFPRLDFDNLEELPHGYSNIGNMYLDPHKQIVLDVGIEQTENFSTVVDVTYTMYSEPICISIIDCGAAGTGEVYASIINEDRKSHLSEADLDPSFYTWRFDGIELKEICDNHGVFFGCIDTVYGNEDAPVPLNHVIGKFGDKLTVEYRSHSPEDQVYTKHTTPIFLTTGDHKYWSYEQITKLILEDSVKTTMNRLKNIKSRITKMKDILFPSGVLAFPQLRSGEEETQIQTRFMSEEVSRYDCVDQLFLTPDLGSSISMESYQFLVHLQASQEDRKEFLDLLEVDYISPCGEECIPVLPCD